MSCSEREDVKLSLLFSSVMVSTSVFRLLILKILHDLSILKSHKS